MKHCKKPTFDQIQKAIEIIRTVKVPLSRATLRVNGDTYDYINGKWVKQKDKK